MDERERRETFECRCHAEQIVATQWESEDELYLCMWTVGSHSWAFGGWRSRLRHAWLSLRNGNPYADEVILNKADAARLGLWLLGSPSHSGARNVPSTWISPMSWTTTNDSTVQDA